MDLAKMPDMYDIAVCHESDSSTIIIILHWDCKHNSPRTHRKEEVQQAIELIL